MSAIGDALASISARHWATVTVDSSANSVLFSAGGSTGTFFTYSMEAPFDPSRNLMWFRGAAHGGGANITALLKYVEATNVWTKVMANGATGMAGGDHSYDHTVIDPITGYVYAIQGQSSSSFSIWRYRPGIDSVFIQRLEVFGEQPQIAMATAWWPGTLGAGDAGGTMIIVEPYTAHLVLYNPVTNTVFNTIDLSAFTIIGRYESWALYNSTTNSMLFNFGGSNIGGDTDLPKQCWRLNSDLTVTRSLTLYPGPAGSIGICSNPRCNINVDPISGLYMVLDAGVLYSLDSTGSSGAWTLLNLPGDTPPSGLNPIDTANAIVSFPVVSTTGAGGICYVNTRSGATVANMYVYKYSDGTTSAPSAPSAPTGTAPNFPGVRKSGLLNWFGRTR